MAKTKRRGTRKPGGSSCPYKSGNKKKPAKKIGMTGGAPKKPGVRRRPRNG